MKNHKTKFTCVTTTMEIEFYEATFITIYLCLMLCPYVAPLVHSSPLLSGRKWSLELLNQKLVSYLLCQFLLITWSSFVLSSSSSQKNTDKSTHSLLAYLIAFKMVLDGHTCALPLNLRLGYATLLSVLGSCKSQGQL